MTIKELHNELIAAYSVNNLNTISLTLINLFRNKQYTALRRIAEIIGEYTDISINGEGKGFSRLMMLYHPDRAMYHIREINRLVSDNDYDGLKAYSHILKLDRISEISEGLNSFDEEDIDYSPVYDWDLSDLEDEGFRIFDASEPEGNISTKAEKPEGYTFLEALIIREFGDADIDYVRACLEHYDDFELSSHGISDLDGVQFCINARSIDVSNNCISDILPLTGLEYLEDLNLSDNEVGLIDEIGNLKRLKTLHLSNNEIEDISPLLGMSSLEYADLSGNRIKTEQIFELVSNGVSVDY